MNDNYVNKVNYYNKIVREKNNKIKENCLDIDNDFFVRHSIKRISIFQRNSIISILNKNDDYMNKISLTKKRVKKDIKLDNKPKIMKKQFKQSLTIDNQKKKISKFPLFMNKKIDKILLKESVPNSNQIRNKNIKQDTLTSFSKMEEKNEKSRSNEAKNRSRKSQVLPKVIINNNYNHIIETEVKRKSISIIPLILPNISPSNRIVHKYQIGNY